MALARTPSHSTTAGLHLQGQTHLGTRSRRPSRVRVPTPGLGRASSPRPGGRWVTDTTLVKLPGLGKLLGWAVVTAASGQGGVAPSNPVRDQPHSVLLEESPRGQGRTGRLLRPRSSTWRWRCWRGPRSASGGLAQGLLLPGCLCDRAGREGPGIHLSWEPARGAPPHSVGDMGTHTHTHRVSMVQRALPRNPGPGDLGERWMRPAQGPCAQVGSPLPRLSHPPLHSPCPGLSPPCEPHPPPLPLLLRGLAGTGHGPLPGPIRQRGDGGLQGAGSSEEDPSKALRPGSRHPPRGPLGPTAPKDSFHPPNFRPSCPPSPQNRAGHTPHLWPWGHIKLLGPKALSTPGHAGPTKLHPSASKLVHDIGTSAVSQPPNPQENPDYQLL